MVNYVYSLSFPSLPRTLPSIQTLYTKQHLSRGPPRHAHKNSSSSSPSSSTSFPLTKAEEDLFHERLGCLLFRYQALAATDRDHPSYPSSPDTHIDNADERSLPPRVFDVLASLFGAEMECFASPFNSRYSVFCSSQWDLDGYFGSIGSFFAFRPLDGMYVAHPPRVPGVVEGMFKVRAKGRERKWRELGGLGLTVWIGLFVCVSGLTRARIYHVRERLLIDLCTKAPVSIENYTIALTYFIACSYKSTNESHKPT